MSTYLIINIAIVSIPLLLSWHPKIAFYRRYKALLFSVIGTDTLFIAWDALVTHRGDWSFNPAYIGSKTLLGLPIEEILFFITVPYSCLFTFEALSVFIPQKTGERSSSLLQIIALVHIPLLLSIGYMARNQAYTLTVSIITAAIIGISYHLQPALLKSNVYGIWLVLCFALFSIVNTLLTALPVVVYNPDAIIGIRIGTIPIEDFYYNYGLLTLYLTLYVKAKTMIKTDRTITLNP